MLRNNRFFVNTIGRLALFAGLCLAVVIGTALMSQSSAQLTRMIGIHAIKLGDDDGGRSAGVNPQQVKQWVDKANEIYAPTGIQFHFDPDPGGPDWSTLVNTALNNLSSSDQRGW